MARGTPYRFRRFARGLNSAVGIYNLREGFSDDPTGQGAEARDVLNVTSSQRGSIRKRYGSTTLQARAGLKDMAAVTQGAGGVLLYSATDGNIYSRTAGGSELTVATGQSIVAPWKFLRLPDVGLPGGLPYYGINGVDTPLRGGDSGLFPWTTSSGNVPNGRFMVYAGNRLWITGVEADPTAVYWSEIGDPTNWPVANVTRFDSSDGKPVTGISTAGPYVLVFKERAIWRIYDFDTSANQKVGDQAGTVSPYAIVPTENGTYFLDPERGVMLTDGSTIKRASEQIQPTWDRVTLDDKRAAWGAFWNNHLYIAARLDAATPTVFDHDKQTDSWWLHSGAQAPLVTWDMGSGAQLIGATATSIVNLYVPGTFDDSGATYRTRWSGPFHEFGQSSIQKRCRRVQLDGRGIVHVYVANDFLTTDGSDEGNADFVDQSAGLFGGSGLYGGAGFFGGNVTIGRGDLYSLGVGRVWSLTFTEQSSADWELDTYVFWMDLRKD